MEGIEQGVLVVLSVSLCCVAALADFIATLNPLLGKARTRKGVRGDHYSAYTIHSASAHPIARSHDYRGRVQEDLDIFYITTTNDNDHHVRHQNLPRSKVYLLLLNVGPKANSEDTCQAPKPKLSYPALPTQPSRSVKRNPRMRIIPPNSRVGKG